MNKASMAIAIAMVTVVALQDQRCRAGRTFSREAQNIPMDELTEDELAALRADPFLYVTESEAVDAAADAAAQAEADAAVNEAKAKAKAKEAKATDPVKK